MTTAEYYDAVIAQARQLMLAKNADYGESWREMRITSITDQLLVKVKRIRQLEDMAMRGEAPKVSEGVESEYRDILNYCVFALIKMSEANVPDAL
jgi:hypothetical protein